jgi:hypothetical protein
MPTIDLTDDQHADGRELQRRDLEGGEDHAKTHAGTFTLTGATASEATR